MPECRCAVLYQIKNPVQKTWASSLHPNRLGNSGRYFIVRNWDSEYGLSLETCGRECDFVTPRSARNKATGFDVIDDPRSAWMVSVPGTISWFSHVFAINVSPVRRSRGAPPSSPRRSG